MSSTSTFAIAIFTSKVFVCFSSPLIRLTVNSSLTLEVAEIKCCSKPRYSSPSSNLIITKPRPLRTWWTHEESVLWSGHLRPDQGRSSCCSCQVHKVTINLFDKNQPTLKKMKFLNLGLPGKTGLLWWTRRSCFDPKIFRAPLRHHANH